MSEAGFRAHRVAGFALTSPNAARLAQFYVNAFGAHHESIENLGGAEFERELGVRGGALCHHLKLGQQAIAIMQFETPGRPHPGPISPYNAVFQHLAIVVSDMAVGFSRLGRTTGWTPISIGGPQVLPPASGGVTAFKFQDPDGHPLELLQFATLAVPPQWQSLSKRDGIFLGIDHTAISVSDTAVSTAFYQSLGFGVSSKSLNHGVEQANLDGVPDPLVEVTALSAQEPTPHLELLRYRDNVHRPRQVLESNDVAATCIYLSARREEESGGILTKRCLIVDPDGHHLLLVP